MVESKKKKPVKRMNKQDLVAEIPKRFGVTKASAEKTSDKQSKK
jgi:hypothetical protein